MENHDVVSVATKNLPGSKATARRQKPRRSYQSHGFTPQLRARYKADRGQIDGRSALGQAMAQYKANLVSDLGGQGSLSTQELTLVEMCAKDWLILQSIDAYLLQVGVFNKRKKSAHALTGQRMQIADSLTRRLQSLGLQRRAKPTQSLGDLLSQASSEPQP